MRGEVVLVNQGLAGYALTDQPQRAMIGCYLAAYDPEAHDGLGEAEWTPNPALAKRFPDAAAALECWKQVPKSRPTRGYGSDPDAPNRPLTAFTVEVREAP